jgi:hypothetical protein
VSDPPANAEDSGKDAVTARTVHTAFEEDVVTDAAFYTARTFDKTPDGDDTSDNSEPIGKLNASSLHDHNSIDVSMRLNLCNMPGCDSNATTPIMPWPPESARPLTSRIRSRSSFSDYMVGRNGSVFGTITTDSVDDAALDKDQSGKRYARKR